MPYRILGVDLAYRRSGLVVLEDGQLAHQSVVTITSGIPTAFFEAQGKWLDIKYRWQPNILVAEVPDPIWRTARKSNYNTIVRIAQMLPILVLSMSPCHVSLVESGTWKKFFTGRHNASKTATSDIAHQMCDGLIDDEDVADAFLIALWEFRHNLGAQIVINRK